MALIELKELCKNYCRGSQSVHALQDVSLKINAGDFVSVAGPSGSGKTTMMNIIGLLDSPSSGELFLQGRPASKMGRQKRTRTRRRELGFIFQSFNLLPVLSVFENIELPLLLERKRPTSRERRDRVLSLAREVGLEDRLGHRPSELSGGQQQRVAIARALAPRPALIIADEPTANLDSETGARVLELMRRVNREEGTTFLFSTHDPAIRDIAEHVLYLQDGRLHSEQRS